MYEKIVQEYYAEIKDYCISKLNNQKSADEITQEVSFTLYKKMHGIRLNKNIK